MPSTRSSASHVPQDGQRTQKQQPGTKPTTAILPPLPDVVKREIVSYLPMADAKSLALANWEWKTYAESHLWASMLVSSEHDPWTYISESDRDIKCQKVQKSIRQRLESHPDRVASVKRLVVHDWPGTSGNSSAIPGTPEDSAAIVRLVAPTVETLEESSICQIHTSDACAKATIPHRIFAQQPFPRLKTLKTHFDRNWSTSLPGVLRTMPNLGKLFLWGESDWEDLAGRLTDWPPLDRVFELILEGNVESTNVVSTLLPLCPSLRKLELRLGDDTDKEPHEYDREGISAMISVILNCATRESLTIGHEVNTYFMAEFEPGQRDPILTGHLPNLKHLNLMSKIVHPHCVPRRPFLRKLHLRWHEQGPPHKILSSSDFRRLYLEVKGGGTFGTKPSRTTSGKLSLALVERLGSAPRLSIIVADEVDEEACDLERNELHVQSFTNGDRALYHCRIKATNEAFPFYCHPGSYSQPISSTKQWKDQPQNKFRRNMDQLSFEDIIGPFSLDSQYNLEPEDPNATDFTADEYELTDYKNHNLPLLLLDYIYSQANHPRDWDKGVRGLTLPDHVCELLDGWVDEVEKLRILV